MILFYEPESLDRWIGQNIQKDEVSVRYRNGSTGKWLSQKLAKCYEAYHARHLQRNRTGDKVDRYVHIVDKCLPKVAEEARIYVGRFPDQAGELLQQVRKIRREIRAKRGKAENHDRRPSQDTATMTPREASTRASTRGAVTRAEPAGDERIVNLPRGEHETKECCDVASQHGRREQTDDETPPGWGGSTRTTHSRSQNISASGHGGR